MSDKEWPRMMKPHDSSRTTTGNDQASYKGLQDFAATLTQRVRELEQKERSYEIMPGQSTEILASMIENYVLAVIRVMAKERPNT